MTMPLPRPPEFAEREEFEAARASGTVVALELFIARHPDSRWRREAEQMLRDLTKPKNGR